MRSAVSSERVGAVTRADVVARRHAVAVGDEVLDVGRGVAAHGVDRSGGDGEPGDDAVAAAAERADAALVGRHGGDRRDVDAAHEVLGDGHPHERRDGVGVEAGREQAAARVVGERVERRHQPMPHGDRRRRRPTSRWRRQLVAGSGKSVRRWQPRLSVRAVAAATTAAATVSTFVASQAARFGGVADVDLAGDGVSTSSAAAERARRPGRRRRGATSRRGRRCGQAGSRSAAGRSSRTGSTRAGHLPGEVAPEAGAGDDALGEAVGGQPVGAVHARARDLADGVETGQRGRAVESAGHAAAREVGGRRDRDAVAGRIDADLAARLGDRREARRRSARPGWWRRGRRGRRRHPAPRAMRRLIAAATTSRGARSSSGWTPAITRSPAAS